MGHPMGCRDDFKVITFWPRKKIFKVAFFLKENMSVLSVQETVRLASLDMTVLPLQIGN